MLTYMCMQTWQPDVSLKVFKIQSVPVKSSVPLFSASSLRRQTRRFCWHSISISAAHLVIQLDYGSVQQIRAEDFVYLMRKRTYMRRSKIIVSDLLRFPERSRFVHELNLYQEEGVFSRNSMLEGTRLQVNCGETSPAIEQVKDIP